ncbi:hypothetical protein RDI58_019754 [Solanum bulbocastanum]|uniref:Uncharacterized protein n=1 Tax=Solanum bulbocastanum TaxID=147425 RepID=A0AAN8TC93_SOLBU
MSRMRFFVSFGTACQLVYIKLMNLEFLEIVPIKLPLFFQKLIKTCGRFHTHPRRQIIRHQHY